MTVHDQDRNGSHAQIHAALAYCYDHKEELDAELAEWEQKVEALRKQARETPVHQKLRAMGLI